MILFSIISQSACFVSRITALALVELLKVIGAYRRRLIDLKYHFSAIFSMITCIFHTTVSRFHHFLDASRTMIRAEIFYIILDIYIFLAFMILCADAGP